MSAPQMLAHLVDWMLMIRGELPTAPISGLLWYPPLKQIVIYWLPWPKGVPTAPELAGRVASDWNEEHAALCRHIAWFERQEPGTIWPLHPAFGRLSPNTWGVLGYRHTDHHLRQFGV